jgi:hypothetical protein
MIGNVPDAQTIWCLPNIQGKFKLARLTVLVSQASTSPFTFTLVEWTTMPSCI